GEVRILIDQVNQHEIVGRVDDENIRRLLLAAAKDPADPGIRADSVDLLKNEGGSDVRDALLYSAQHDSNAAVRIKALEGLRRFAGDAETRNVLKFVLQNDASADVRSEAIDVLAPANQTVELSPDMITTLQLLVRSGQDVDDYTRGRALQLLRQVNAPGDLY
ncbi:MAG: HEAT repeat domain-containing protein, partial [Acidobacteriaceae bacterium]|nr:HEAT repeat domain-containing protein [Acidobacteriaceae bacterium]